MQEKMKKRNFNVNLEKSILKLEETIHNLSFEYTKNIEERNQLIEKYNLEKNRNIVLFKEITKLKKDKTHLISIQSKIEKIIYQIIKIIKKDLEEETRKESTTNAIKVYSNTQEKQKEDLNLEDKIYTSYSFLEEKDSKFHFYQENNQEESK